MTRPVWRVCARGTAPFISEVAEFSEDAEKVCQLSMLVADLLSVLRALRDLGDMAMVSGGTNPSGDNRNSGRLFPYGLRHEIKMMNSAEHAGVFDPVVTGDSDLT